MKDYHQNIFFYYRSPVPKENVIDFQVENNVTKSFINLLEFSSFETQKKILHKMGFELEKEPIFKLQISSEEAVPDALIQSGKINIFIESKVDAHLDKKQLIRHKQAFVHKPNDYLIAITARPKDKRQAESINRTIFFDWKSITKIVYEEKTVLKSEKDIFLCTQFIEFMEAMGLSAFNGFIKNDFDAFLEGDKEIRQENCSIAKKRFNTFMQEVFNEIECSINFKKPAIKLGNFWNESKGVWTMIWDSSNSKLPPVQTVHYSTYLDSNGFHLQIWSEGKIPNKHLLNNIKSNPKLFTKLCKELEEYNLIIEKKWMTGVRKKDAKFLAELKLGKDYSLSDTQYIINKLSSQKLFQFAIRITWYRDEKVLQNAQFKQELMTEIKSLKKLYSFLIKNE